MDKVYKHKTVEEKLYNTWEKNGYFKPEINQEACQKGDTYTIILPPPNANGNLHFGHAMFCLEDILIRYQRMKGKAALWLPGTDHAGIETQFVYEKKLQQEGKSRFDFSREELFTNIWNYVEENRGGIENQLRRLGFSLDWSREKFTLDPEIIKIVSKTFRDMYEDGLIYRNYRLVNYCTRDGTSFSDLETVSEEIDGILYHIKYPIQEGGYITVATTRPETIYGDVAVMVNPKDKKYKDAIGKTILLPLTNRKIPIIADEYVDMNFATGAVKVTPSHDFNDFEIGRKHELTFPPIIGWNGKFEKTGVADIDGLYVKQARTKTIELLKEKGLLLAEKPHKMVIKKCYKCKTVLEPLPLNQWYLQVNKKLTETNQSLVEMSREAIKNAIEIEPKNFTNHLDNWYKNLKDWNISRQNVWGIRIPVFYEVENESQFAVVFIDKNKKLHQGVLKQLLQEGHAFEDILIGLQSVIAVMGAKVVFEDQRKAGKRYLPETDTFDTWFSSGQWPYVTLKTLGEKDFSKFYPTSVMETGRDILFFWVSRMIMLGLYLKSKEIGDKAKIEKKVPFKTIVLHGLVNDPYGKKMSKSKGNVVNPLEVADQYGADALRFALVHGTALGNDQAMSYPKLEAARKFTNKLWNMARFIEIKRIGNQESEIMSFKKLLQLAQHENDEECINKVLDLARITTTALDSYYFNAASQELYQFIWHYFADKYIEDVKNRINNNSFLILNSLFLIQLKLLHPFMPFITEEIYQKLANNDKSIMIEPWPCK
jgi:valyl-tRNA synthetase